MTSKKQHFEQHEPEQAWCDPTHLYVKLKDGRTIGTPLWWYPSLWAASPAQRNDTELSPKGVHWKELDEDLSIEGMLAGWHYPDAVDPNISSEDEAA